MSRIEHEQHLAGEEILNPNNSLNLMSKAAYEYLKTTIREATENIKQAKLNIGEVGGTSDWHDNFPLEDIHRQIDFWSIVLNMRENHLKDVVFVKPREKTDKVGVGNMVELRFEGKEETEIFLILGHVDATFRESCISFKTPVGKSVLGKSKGEVVKFEVDNYKMTVEIVDILPGNF